MDNNVKIDLKTKILLSRMKNNNYFKDLQDYLKEMVEENKLSYDNLKYLYKNLYKRKSLFIQQNIFPVSQFLIKGYSTDEVEKLARLLPDAKDLTIFCYEEKERGHLFNKLFRDLEFVYNNYDRYVQITNSKEIAFQRISNVIENTDIKQREGEMQLENNEIYKINDLVAFEKEIRNKMDTLRNEFEKQTLNDPKLIEHFKDDKTELRFSSIMVAGTVLGGIDLRNIWRENKKTDGEMEEYPYSEEQIKMIDRYNRLEETLDKIEQYAEFNIEVDEEEEMEYDN